LDKVRHQNCNHNDQQQQQQQINNKAAINRGFLYPEIGCFSFKGLSHVSGTFSNGK
jgi:hypothetical protein